MSLSGSYKSATNPARRASSALTSEPASVHLSAVLIPTTRGRNHDEQPSVAMPRREKTNPNFAVVDAIRMSHGSVRVAP
jgi:hypothetical protein